MLALLLVSACQGDHLSPPSLLDPSVAFWALELNHHAVTMSTRDPYDTLTLVATPRNRLNDALPGLPTPEYHSADQERVQVTPEGMLVAVKPTSSPVAVVATLTVDNLKHTDTVIVRVIDAASPPILGAFSIHPVPPDSAKHAANDGFHSDFAYLLNRLVHAADTAGTAFDSVDVAFEPIRTFPSPARITDLMVAFRSLDTTIAATRHDNSSGTNIYGLMGRQPGTVMVYASTTAFGVHKIDSIPFRIGLPVLSFALVGSDDVRNLDLRLAAGGMIQWFVGAGASVTFLDPTNVGPAIAASSFLPETTVCNFLIFGSACTDAGNIVASGLVAVARTFPVPGTYEYVASAGGEEFPGRVVVVPDP